jgi:hypothetical protein
MNQPESQPVFDTVAETVPKNPPSSLKLMAVITLRILGFRKKQFNEDEFERLSGTQVGIACMLALVGFTAIIAMLSVLAVKVMG